MKVTLCHKTHFNAAYRFFNPNFTAQENINAFGEHNAINPPFHGHNFDIEVKLYGEVNPKTGKVFDKQLLKKIVKQEIEERYDHKNLYDDVEDYKDTVPTVEMMSIRIYEILRPLIPNEIELKIMIQESVENYAEYP